MQWLKKLLLEVEEEDQVVTQEWVEVDQDLVVTQEWEEEDPEVQAVQVLN